MEKVRPWCGQPSDRGRLGNKTEQNTRAQLKDEWLNVYSKRSRAAAN